MIIDWLDYEQKGHVLAWLLVETMSDYGIDKFEGFNSNRLEVKLEVNGIEVDLLKAMDNLNSQLDDVYKKGKEDSIRDIKEHLLNIKIAVSEIETSIKL